MRSFRLLGKDRRGSAIVEFALVAPFLVFLFLGVVSLGITLGRSIQAVQLCRDVAHLYSDGIDFNTATNKSLVVNQLATGTGMTTSGGNGVIIFSKILTVYQTDCTASNVSPCTNLGQSVITQRIVIGNSALRSSAFGTPNGAIVNAATGNISPAVYLSNSDSTVQATSFATTYNAATGGTAQPQGESAWVAESYITYPELASFFNMFGGSGTPGVYSRFIF